MFEITKVPGAVRYRYVGDGTPSPASTPAPKQPAAPPAAARVADLPAREYEREKARMLQALDNGQQYQPEPEAAPGSVRDMSEAEYAALKASMGIRI